MSVQLPDLLSPLAARGLTGNRSISTDQHTIALGPIKSDKSFDVVTWAFTLPTDSGVHASFVAESWKHTLAKLLKTELQLGEARFDEAVHITTSDEATCLKLLRSPQVSNTIQDAVTSGSTIEINGASVMWTKRAPMGEDAQPEPERLSLILSALMGD